MANRLKRVSYSIFLDPLNNPADLYASKVMHQWAEERRKLSAMDESSLALHNAIHVHKQVYLSGLFLHLLNPELSQQLSAQLTESQISEFTLSKTLQGLGLESNDVGSVAKDEQSLGQATLNALQTAITAQVREEALLTREAFTAQSTTPVNNVDSSVDSKAIAESVVEQLSGTNNLLTQQNSRLLGMVESQAKELDALKKMLVAQQASIQALASGTGIANVKEGASTAEEIVSPVSDLNERLASVQKIKKKGIF
ncbi:hypothetical protein [Thaumasiovibrio sp. DFM-14]|uniref:hypothetical protein n=1 Tax=Thaumasiovibrio sp. DFM-14 TaxID=3384792 RepID=UPI0039A22EFE